MLKLTQIKSCKLADLLKSVNKSVSVNEQLSGCFGNVQVVFEELLNGHHGFLSQRVDGTLLEDLAQDDGQNKEGDGQQHGTGVEILLRHEDTQKYPAEENEGQDLADLGGRRAVFGKIQGLDRFFRKDGAEHAEIDDITDACRLLEAAVKKRSRKDVTL